MNKYIITYKFSTKEVKGKPLDTERRQALIDYFDEKDIYVAVFCTCGFFDFVVVFYGYCLLWISRKCAESNG